MLVYSTYYGGCDNKTVADIAVAPDGSVYIVGTTQSNNLPLANPLRSAPNRSLGVFLFKLDATGKNLLYATYLGGSDYEMAGGVGIDLAGNIYITGATRSSDFPVKNGYQMTHASLSNSTTDAFVVKLNPEGNDLLYGTYYGSFEDDEARGMIVTPSGEAYIARMTGAPASFPVLNPLPPRTCNLPTHDDAFVVRLDPAQAGAASRVYSMTFGGCSNDWANDIALDETGAIYIAFESAAANLGAVGNNPQIYLRDIQTGTTTLVSRAVNGEASNIYAMSPAISGDGHYVAFESRSTNLGASIPEQNHIYIWDSVTQTINRLSRPPAGSLVGSAPSFQPAISGDGAVVAFSSKASELAAGIPYNFFDVYAVRPLGYTLLPTVTPTFTNTATQTPQNLISNGSFSNGMAGWATWDAITYRIQNGVFEFYRNSGGVSAVVLHPTGYALPAGAPLEIQLSLGNSSVRKRVVVLMHDADFSDLQVCGFWLAPNTPLRNYIMRMTTTEAWSNTTLSIYGSPADSLGWIQLDNVDVRTVSTIPDAKTLCIDPDTPTPVGGAAGTNLLSNGDFSAPQIAPWAIYGQINGRLQNGVYEFYRLTGAPSGVILQPSGGTRSRRAACLKSASRWVTAATSECARRCCFTNGISVTRRRVLFGLSQTRRCKPTPFAPTTRLPGRTPPSRCYPSPATQAGWLQLDNVVLRQNPSITSTGTECYIGAAPSGSMEMPSEPSVTPEVIIVPTPSLMPTMTVPSELPLLPTSSLIPSPAPQSEGEMSESLDGG
jgi:hypothetical protein